MTAGVSLVANSRTLVMGVLNVTPDSFSDGGQWFSCEQAVKHALEMEAAGADLIDIGGESTRPNATKITAEQEQSRVLPVIEAYRKASSSPLPISIDTLHADTALKAVQAGAAIVNDVSGGAHDPQMAQVVAQLGAYYICQHMRGTPQTMDQYTGYENGVVTGVIVELKQRVERLIAAGVKAEKIILDPGLGFAKTPPQCWELLGSLDKLAEIGYPLLIGASRKRFLAQATAQSTDPNSAVGRDSATAAVSVLCAQLPVWAVRVHDVAASVAAVKTVELVKGR